MNTIYLVISDDNDQSFHSAYDNLEAAEEMRDYLSSPALKYCVREYRVKSEA